jgi:hypothetical protein
MTITHAFSQSTRKRMVQPPVIRRWCSLQQNLSPCHSEAGFIGEESAFFTSGTADSSRDSAALRNDKSFNF